MHAETHRRAVREAFDRAAASYDSEAGMQREVCRRLFKIARDRPPGAAMRRVLDAGCGTGHALAGLAALAPNAELFATDFAPAMLRRANSDFPSAQFICGDLEQLPVATETFDALWSSLSMQWCDPRRVLAECARVLVPGGVAWIATLAPSTLHELRTAFRVIDNEEHVLQFIQPEAWLAFTEAAGFVVETSQREHIALRVPNLRALIRHLKGIGAHRVDARPRRPLGKAEWRRLEAAYEKFRLSDGMLPATYDVLMVVLRRTA